MIIDGRAFGVRHGMILRCQHSSRSLVKAQTKAKYLTKQQWNFVICVMYQLRCNLLDFRTDHGPGKMNRINYGVAMIEFNVSC